MYDMDHATAVLQGSLLGMGRAIGFVSTFPLFTWLEIAGILRLAVAFGLSLPIIAETIRSEVGAATPFLLFSAAFMKEAIVGVGLGVLFGAPIWAMQGAGDVIEMYRGASMEGVYDAVNASESTEAGRFFMVVAMGWYVASGTLTLLLEWYLSLYALWPPGSMTPPLLLAGWEWGAVITWIARYAVVLAAPILIILFLFELALVLGSISGKRLHITELGVTGKNGLFLVVIPVYLVFASVFLAESLRVFASSILSKFDLRP